MKTVFMTLALGLLLTGCGSQQPEKQTGQFSDHTVLTPKVDEHPATPSK